jgi:hypothetical protein
MRRSVVVVLAVLVLLGVSAPPGFAQAPAPKVTINGLVDFITTAYKNLSYAANQDVTNNKERNWYSRERGVFTLTGEIGKVKGVWAVELDFTNGAGNFNAAAPGSLGTIGVTASGTSANFDLDTDIPGAIETKWLYLETPLTGPGSLLPFIPVATIARMGGQPLRGHEYKIGVLAYGDMPGVNLVTTWNKDIRSTLTFVQVGEALDRFHAPNQKDNVAFLASVEMDIFKGLTVKPTYVYAQYDGGNCGTSNLATAAYGGYNPNANCPAVTAGSVAGAGGVGRDINRHYLAADARWTLAGFSFQPSFVYLLGSQEVTNRNGVLNDVDINSFIVDAIGGYRLGPLNLETRIVYTPGVSANHDVQNAGGGTIRTYQPFNSGFSYMSGWTEIWKGDIDYASGLYVGRPSVTLREAPSYDKYGRIFWAVAADYVLTPALTLNVVTNLSWTDTAVDTKGTLGTTGIVPSGITTAGNPFTGGKDRYLGNEWLIGLTYRFAPNMAFDIVGAALFTGNGLNIQRAAAATRCSTEGTSTCESQDIYKMSARFRVTW